VGLEFWRENSEVSRMENLDHHYAQLLGLQSPWEVTDVNLDLEHKRVRIRLEHPNGVAVKCPECGCECTIADRAPERQWRHLDTMQFETALVAATPRAACVECGVKTIAVPWAGKNSRFTLMFESFALKVIEACGCVEQARELLRIGWDAVQRIMERGVARGLERRKLDQVRYAGIDEKSFRKGHNYVSVLNDLEEARVLEVVEGRTRQSADSLWQTLGGEVLGSIEAVAMDMWEAFMKSTRANVPQALIVHDRFHIAGYLTKAVNQVRSREHRKLLAAGDETLTGSKFLWLFSVENITEERWMHFEQLLKMDLKCAEAWAMKESMRHFWDYKYEGNARKFFTKWLNWVNEHGEEPMKKVGRMLESHLPEVLNYFSHRITNAVSEGLNSKIQAIKSMARGFRGFKNYRVRILFFCGKLNMAISHPTH
jgi:transposase